jgi:hypothetical protein
MLLPLMFLMPPPPASGQLPLELSRPRDDGSDIDPRSYQGPLADRALARTFKGLFSSALVGRYLDLEPARRRAAFFRSRGLTSFVLTKRVEEARTFGSSSVGVFYVVMVGLFGEPEAADHLGQRLRAEGLVQDYRILPVDDPGELSSADSQNQELYRQSALGTKSSADRGSRPLDPQKSPAASGRAFRQHVYGRYLGSYRDPLAARDEAGKMTRSGWPASVEKDGQWYRVYLAPGEDHRDFKADGDALKAARSSAASQPGFFILADMSGLKGTVRPITPNASRTDASACAGFSEAGRLGAGLSRTIVYVPDSSFTAALTPVYPQPVGSWKEIPQRVKAWWADEKSRPEKKSLFGPAIFNRPEMEKAVGRLAADPGEASLAIGLTEISGQLASVPGRKILLVFSEFRGPDQPQDVAGALSRLTADLGPALEVNFIYGDSNAAGYALASDLARQAGGRAWDGCRLLGDNAYFEQYIKSIFK